jgi:hypothetical protein
MKVANPEEIPELKYGYKKSEETWDTEGKLESLKMEGKKALC